jgi:O6-methylguanine-DNA--protein-cysteine methyltransferase
LLVALPALLLVVPEAVSASAATTSSAASSNSGWVRLAHLSPNTPAVDVYLYSYGDSSAMQVLHHVAYGTVSSYESIAAGDYTVEMRAAGAAAASKPVLSASLDVVKGGSYTVVGLGPESGLRLEVLKDQLTTSSGQSEVRIIQASLKQPKVSVTWHGHTTVSDLPFGQVSAYEAVAPATATLHISGASGSTTSTVTLTAGTVHTLVVLDGAKGLTLDNFTDAAGSGSAPAGGAATGFGGTAPRDPAEAPWLYLIGAGLLLAAAGGLALRRRPQHLSA